MYINGFTEDELNNIKENKKEEKEFSKCLEKLLHGDKKVASSPLLVGKTPNAISICCDYGELDLTISKSVIYKCMMPEIRDNNGKRTKKSGHGLTKQQVLDVLWAFKRPLMVLKGSSKNTLAVMTDQIDNDGRYIFVFIRLNNFGQIQKNNCIASIYGREGLKEYINQCIKKDYIIAVNIEKVDELRLSIGGDFPKATTFINFNSTIAYSIKSVKYPI